MANLFEISIYEPNQKLVLKSKKTTDTLIYYVPAAMLFLGISFTAVTASFYPIIVLSVVAFVSLIALKYQLIQQITFTPNQIVVGYAIGFIKWQQHHNKIIELDWFVNVEEKLIKIGRKNSVILQLALEKLETLPLLTQNVSELMMLEVDMNETVGKWENLRLSSPKQLSNQTQFHNLTIQNDSLSVKILLHGIRRFEVNLKRKNLKYSRWMTTKTIELKDIKAIYYYFEDSDLMSDSVAKWSYVDKHTAETVLFFKYRRSGDQYEEPQYGQLNFKIDNRNLAKLLRDLPELNHIEIKEQKL